MPLLSYRLPLTTPKANGVIKMSYVTHTITSDQESQSFQLVSTSGIYIVSASATYISPYNSVSGMPTRTATLSVGWKNETSSSTVLWVRARGIQTNASNNDKIQVIYYYKDN